MGKAILIELIASLIVALLGYLRKKFLITLSKRDPRSVRFSLGVLLFFWALSHGINIYLYLKQLISIEVFLIFFTSISGLLIYFIYVELNQFWRLGFRGTDQKVIHGLDYSKALKLIKNEFCFLGTGAAKLTRELFFEEALSRCRPDKPIKFLLSKPTDGNLIRAAMRANRPSDEYTRIVLDSLRKISNIRENRGLTSKFDFIQRPQFITQFSDCFS